MGGARVPASGPPVWTGGSVPLSAAQAERAREGGLGLGRAVTVPRSAEWPLSAESGFGASASLGFLNPVPYCTAVGPSENTVASLGLSFPTSEVGEEL